MQVLNTRVRIVGGRNEDATLDDFSLSAVAGNTQHSVHGNQTLRGAHRIPLQFSANAITTDSTEKVYHPSNPTFSKVGWQYSLSLISYTHALSC